MNLEAESNLYELKKELKAVEEYMLGLRTPVELYICDENGKVSDVKIAELANRVISRECMLYGCDVGISGSLKRYYELLFYLLFRTYDPRNQILCFADVLETTKHLQKDYRNREEFLLRESGCLGGHARFFQWMEQSCKLLGGQPLSADLDSEKMEKMEESFYRKTALMDKWNSEKQSFREKVIEKYKDYGLEGYQSYDDALANEYWYKYPDAYISEEDREEPEGEPLSFTYDRKQDRFLTRKEEWEWINTEEERRRAWIESFEDPQKYLDAYREFCELNWCVDVVDTENNLTDHLLDILEFDGFNKIGEVEKFRRVRAEIIRGRKLAKRQF